MVFAVTVLLTPSLTAMALHAGRLGNGERTRIFGRSVRRDTPVGRIVDVSTLLGRDGHGRLVVEERLRVDGRRSDGHATSTCGIDFEGLHAAFSLNGKCDAGMGRFGLRLPVPVVLETTDKILSRNIGVGERLGVSPLNTREHHRDIHDVRARNRDGCTGLKLPTCCDGTIGGY